MAENLASSSWFKELVNFLTWAPLVTGGGGGVNSTGGGCGASEQRRHWIRDSRLNVDVLLGLASRFGAGADNILSWRRRSFEAMSKTRQLRSVSTVVRTRSSFVMFGLCLTFSYKDG